MRPINLIPEDQRRSHGTIARTGPLAYLIVGALGVLLLGMVMLVLTSNQISDRQGEVKTLEGERANVAVLAEKLAPYVSFQQVAETRTQTVAGLAESRFDWVRVIRQLSLVLPPRVYLTTLTASSGGGESGGTVPNLAIAGCAPGQDTVAAFVASLKEIDGVTRVGLENSISGGAEGESKQSGGTGCQAAGVYLFALKVNFDGAPGSPDSAGPLEIASETEASTEGGSSTEGTGGETESSTETPAPESSTGTQASAAPAEATG